MKNYLKYAFTFGIIKKAVIFVFLFSNYSFAQQNNTLSKVFFNLALEDKPKDLANWYASFFLLVATHMDEMGYDASKEGYISPENDTKTIRFGTLPRGILAVAQEVYNDCRVDIIINNKDWLNASQQRRMWTYYHEMAHDAFNLDHGEGGELMNAYIPKEKITSIRLYNAIRSMVRYAVRYGKYERGSGFCDNGTIYRKNGTNYVSKKGSVYRDHQSSSSYKRPSSSSSYNRSSSSSSYNRSSNKSYTRNSTKKSSNSSGWEKRYVIRSCYIVKEPSIFGEQLRHAAKNFTVEVKFSEVDKSGKFVRARLTKISPQGWINISHLK